MTPEHKAHNLLDRFKDMAEEVAEECKRSVDAVRVPYWVAVLDSLKIERLKRVEYTKSDVPYHYE
jgi:hypothetical protein